MALNNEQQRITYLNPAFIQTFGYTLEDIPTLSDWWPKAYPDPEYRLRAIKTWHTELDRVKRTGDAFSSLELNVRCKNGEIKTALISAASLTDAFEGEHVVVLIDVTERKRTEERLNATEKRLAKIFQSSPAAMCITTLQTGMFLDFNDVVCEITGYSREELLSRSISDFLYLAPEDRHDLVREIIEHGSLKSDEFPFRHKNGTIGCALRSIERLTLDGQDCILSMFIDITERKRIDEELQISRQRLESLSRQLITTQESERRHLSRELHDEIGQTLTAIKMNLRRTQQAADANLQSNLDQNIAMVDQAIGRVRNLALSLRPAQLDELGLIAALHWLVKHQADLGGFQNHFEAEIGSIQISADLQTVCFRIAQEALTNIVRHGKPSKVHVKLWVKDDQLHLSIHDDGVGFDLKEVNRRALEGGSFGLISMQERASLAGGDVQIDSAPGCGTRIDCWFPLAASSSQ